jgi:pyruvate kinase
LGVELPPEQVPYYQKHIINRCVAIGKPVITATQMLESMVFNPYPTRAEVSDVANAIYDHTDAIMLSGETAIGKYPKEAVMMMASTAAFIEQHCKPPRVTFEMTNQTDALTHSAVEFFRQNYEGVPEYKAFVLLTESGYAARMLSRHRPILPIIALTRHKHVLRRLQLERGVTPFFFPHEMKEEESSSVTQIAEMLKIVRNANFLPEKSSVIMIYGSEWGKPGRTNVLRVEQI